MAIYILLHWKLYLIPEKRTEPKGKHKKRGAQWTPPDSAPPQGGTMLFYGVYDYFKSLWLVHREVSKNLTVDDDTFSVELTDKF